MFCFQYKEDAYKFYEELIIRLKEFNLEISKEKTKIIKLEKDDNDDNSGGNSFDFLGFTHYCTESKNGYKYTARKTSKKKYNASLLRCKEWMKYNRILPTKEFMKKIVVKIIGHCNYYAVTGNSCICQLKSIPLFN